MPAGEIPDKRLPRSFPCLVIGSNGVMQERKRRNIVLEAGEVRTERDIDVIEMESFEVRLIETTKFFKCPAVTHQQNSIHHQDLAEPCVASRPCQKSHPERVAV